MSYVLESKFQWKSDCLRCYFRDGTDVSLFSGRIARYFLEKRERHPKIFLTSHSLRAQGISVLLVLSTCSDPPKPLDSNMMESNRCYCCSQSQLGSYGRWLLDAPSTMLSRTGPTLNQKDTKVIPKWPWGDTKMTKLTSRYLQGSPTRFRMTPKYFYSDTKGMPNWPQAPKWLRSDPKMWWIFEDIKLPD